MEQIRNLAVIGDGSTDREIFSYLAKQVIGEDLYYVELNRQKLHDAVEKYWHQSRKTNRYYFPASHAYDLKKTVFNILTSAVGEFMNNLQPGDWLKSTDVLLLTTDAEKSLNEPDNYFDLENISIFTILCSAISHFYEIRFCYGEKLDTLPIIIPIVTFPSTEIMIAAAKQLEIKKYYGRKPNVLKNLLYGKDTALSQDELVQGALAYLSADGISNVSQSVPESRLFIQTLAALRCE